MRRHPPKRVASRDRFTQCVKVGAKPEVGWVDGVGEEGGRPDRYSRHTPHKSDLYGLCARREHAMQAIHETSSREPVMIAKAKFQKMIAGWASDVLALRRRGWDRPCLRTGLGRGCAAPVRRAGRSSGRRRAA